MDGFDWNRARAFLATAEEGSLSAAARVLGTTQPTVGRQVSALESELGLTLFARAGNRLELTEAGLDLLEPLRAMGEAATRVELAAAGQAVELDGIVVITASELICAHLLPPILLPLRRAHPGIEIELVAANEVRDLLRREADIAIRNVGPAQAELFGRNLGAASARMYATPDYLDRLGNPTTPEGFADAEFFGFDRSDLMIDGLAHLGMTVTHRNFPVVTAAHLVQWEMCKRGGGICFVMEEVGDAEPRVVRALPDFPALQFPMWLVAHQELKTNRRIRVVFDALAEGLGR